ncbi:hypothetical protein vfu_B00917 [Vibrio furnissii NCTC 11218]|nr:hypothetical protein vfu_B00917 [Vibrio furnissii NCTC 11218]
MSHRQSAVLKGRISEIGIRKITSLHIAFLNKAAIDEFGITHVGTAKVALIEATIVEN